MTGLSSGSPRYAGPIAYQGRMIEVLESLLNELVSLREEVELCKAQLVLIELNTGS